MKPDFGFYHLQNGYRKDLEISFYNVSFVDIGFVAPHAYSVMFDYPFNDTVYALTFDFFDDIFAHLLSKLSSAARDHFGQSIIGRNFPFIAKLPLQVTADLVVCRLGEIVHGAHNDFVPFIVIRIE